MRSWCIFICVLLISSHSFSQISAKRVDHSYVIRHFTEANGLLANQNTLYQDSTGMLWLASLQGLQTFDGVRFRNLTGRTNDPYSCPMDFISFFVEHSGEIWLGGDGVVVYRRATERFHTLAELFPSLPSYPQKLRAMFQDPSGNIWIHDWDRRIFKYQRRENRFFLFAEKFTTAEDTLQLMAFNGYCFPDSMTMFGVDVLHWPLPGKADAIYRMDLRTGRATKDLKGIYRVFRDLNDVFHIVFDRYRSCFWIVHENSTRLFRMNAVTGESRSYSFSGELKVHTGDPHGNIRMSRPVIDRQGTIWINTLSGMLIRINEADEFSWFKSQTDDPLGFWGMSEGNQRASVPAVTDGREVIWASSKTGINMIRKQPSGINFIPVEPEPTPFNAVKAIRGIHGKRYAVLSYPDQVPVLAVYDSSFNILFHQKLGKGGGEMVMWDRYFHPDSIYLATYFSGEGQTWYVNPLTAITREFFFDTRTLKLSEVRLPQSGRYRYMGMPDDSGFRWYYFNDTCYRFDPDSGVLDHFVVGRKDSASFPMEYAFTVHPASNQLFVDVFPKNEILQIDLVSRKLVKAIRLAKENSAGYCADPIFGISNYDDEYIQLKSQNDIDLLHVRNGSVIHLRQLTGRMVNFSTPTFRYGERLWVFGQFNIAAIDLSAQTARKWDFGKDFMMSLSATVDELPDASDGRVLVYGGRGVYLLDTAEMLRPVHPGQVRFTSIRIDNTAVPVDSVIRAGGITVEHNGYTSIAFYFTDGSFYGQKNIHYQYALLKGRDSAWVTIEGQPELVFRNLAPGNYTLVIKAMGDEKFSAPLSIRMIILPPFWQEPWFLALVFILLAAGGFLVVHQRIRRVRLQQHEKMREILRRESERTAHILQVNELEMQSLRAQLNPHFMFNSLNAIQQLILRNDAYRSHIYLARFAKLLRMMLEHSEKPFVPLRMELDFLELYLSLEKLRIPDLDYSIETAGVDADGTLLPNMILQPYIENALWHGLSPSTRHKLLRIRVMEDGGRLVTEIEDNGIGREKAAELKRLHRKEHRSKGMELLSRRFQLLSREFGFGIEINITDLVYGGQAAGTLVRISLPLRREQEIKILTHDTGYNHR